MKKTIILLILIFLATSIASARTKRRTQARATVNNGWVRESVTDEYTTETSYIMCYYKNGDVHAIYFPHDGTLKIIELFDGLKYFDQTWDAAVYNNGRFSSKSTEVSMRIIRSKSDYDEEVLDQTVYYSSIDHAGDSFISAFFVDIEPEILKKSQSISFRWIDKLVYETFTININLSGFTKCYNSAIK